MDEICLNKLDAHSLYHVQQLFLHLCNHQRIFVLLYQFIGFSGFVELSATNSQVNKAINKHQEVQVLLLKLKVKKLKQRQLKRSFPFFWRIDLALYNPFLLSVHNENNTEKHEDDEQFGQEEKIIIEAKKNHQHDMIANKYWKKWKLQKKLSNLQAVSQSKSQNLKLENNLSHEKIQVQKLQKPLKKQKIFENIPDQNEELVMPILKKQVKDHEYYIVDNMQRRILPADQNQRKKNYIEIQIKAAPPLPKHPSELMEVKDQFYLAWDPKIKQKTFERLWPEMFKKQSSWSPFEVPRRMKQYVKNSSIYSSLKTKVTEVIRPKIEKEKKNYLSIRIQ